jgi:hypothetical protein
MATPADAFGSVEPPVPRWAWTAIALALGLLWMVAFDGGLVSSRISSSASMLHEMFHDGRHLFGVPCH